MSWFKHMFAGMDFMPTDNAGRVIKKKADGVYSCELAEHQQPKATKALEHLVKYGKITNADVYYKYHLTDGRKLFTDWRRKGYLREANDPQGHDTVPNKDGKGTHRVHYYTGKPIEEKGKKVDVSC